jgi:hypothetical protein
MLPADSIVRAAVRWLRLLRASTLGKAWAIILADAGYTDLTQTQYAAALEWLRSLDLLNERHNGGLDLSPTIRALPEEQVNQLLFEGIIARAAPPWLANVDLLVPDGGELPQDAASLAENLGLSEGVAFLAIRHLHGRIDLAERARVGAAGERALLEYLERRWPGSTSHVAEADDGFGYDVLFRHDDVQWHLEVKATTRRGRLVIYLSRHEHEVSLQDAHWRLVVVGLDEHLRLKALATVRHLEVLSRAPHDTCIESKWQSTSHELAPRDLQEGLSFLNDAAGRESAVRHVQDPKSTFAWMPER